MTSDKPPARYVFLGFKDRDLEVEYTQDLALVLRARITLGFVISLLLFFGGIFLKGWVSLPMEQWAHDNIEASLSDII